MLRTDGTGEAAAAAARAQAGLADHVAAANVVVAQRAMAERALILAATGGGTGGGTFNTFDWSYAPYVLYALDILTQYPLGLLPKHGVSL